MKLKVTVISAAALAAVAPSPSQLIEHRYSRGVYLWFQPALTSFSNLFPFALLDVFAVVALLAGGTLVARHIRRRRARTALAHAALQVLLTAAALYLVFLASWGLNYRRLPLEQKLDFHSARLSTEAATRFAATAVEQTNTLYAAAHQTPLAAAAIEDSFIETQQLLGAVRVAEPGRAKRSLLQAYFRWTAISGMTVPGFLEVILNPDLLTVETPFTLAHEWAHLAGYADESEANFFAWLTCIRSADPLVRYSGWLEAYGLAIQAVPRSARASLPKLGDGPRADLQAINERLSRSSPRARTVARGVYDSYLKANRVEEGIRSYDAALRLMLGTQFEDGWKPTAREP